MSSERLAQDGVTGGRKVTKQRCGRTCQHPAGSATPTPQGGTTSMSSANDPGNRPEDRTHALSERWLTAQPADVALRSKFFSVEPPRVLRV